jgi:hypothetical protein
MEQDERIESPAAVASAARDLFQKFEDETVFDKDAAKHLIKAYGTGGRAKGGAARVKKGCAAANGGRFETTLERKLVRGMRIRIDVVGDVLRANAGWIRSRGQSGQG